MIVVTRLNGHRMLLNPDLIKTAEPAPDTTITLVTGEKLVVLEACDDLMRSIASYRSAVLREAWPTAAEALNMHPVPTR